MENANTAVAGPSMDEMSVAPFSYESRGMLNTVRPIMMMATVTSRGLRSGEFVLRLSHTANANTPMLSARLPPASRTDAKSMAILLRFRS